MFIDYILFLGGKGIASVEDAYQPEIIINRVFYDAVASPMKSFVPLLFSFLFRAMNKMKSSNTFYRELSLTNSKNMRILQNLNTKFVHASPKPA